MNLEQSGWIDFLGQISEIISFKFALVLILCGEMYYIKGLSIVGVLAVSGLFSVIVGLLSIKYIMPYIIEICVDQVRTFITLTSFRSIYLRKYVVCSKLC